MDKKINNLLSAEALAAGERYIDNLKSGVIKIPYLNNTADEYPEEKSLDSFKSFVKSDTHTAMIKDGTKSII